MNCIVQGQSRIAIPAWKAKLTDTEVSPPEGWPHGATVYNIFEGMKTVRNVISMEPNGMGKVNILHL